MSIRPSLNGPRTRSRPREAMFAYLDIPTDQQAEQTLLVDDRKRIKKPDVLIHVIDNLPLRSLPYSFSRVRKLVKDRLGGDYA